MTDYTYELRAEIPRYLVEVVPGEPLALTVPILAPDENGDPAPVPVGDAAQWSARAQLRSDAASGALLHEFTTDTPANVTITAGAAGTVTLDATAAQTAAWQAAWTGSPPEAVADLFVTDADGIPRCLADLVFALLPRTTREDD